MQWDRKVLLQERLAIFSGRAPLFGAPTFLVQCFHAHSVPFKLESGVLLASLPTDKNPRPDLSHTGSEVDNDDIFPYTSKNR